MSPRSPAGGAAGGLGAGLTVFCGAKLRHGFDMVADAVGLDKKIRNADLVFTGEGRTDEQTAYGKLPRPALAADLPDARSSLLSCKRRRHGGHDRTVPRRGHRSVRSRHFGGTARRSHETRETESDRRRGKRHACLSCGARESSFIGQARQIKHAFDPAPKKEAPACGGCFFCSIRAAVIATTTVDIGSIRGQNQTKPKIQ